MAGIGPPPKDPRLRQRRNKVTTAAELKRTRNKAKRIPGLHVRSCECAEKRRSKRKCRVCKGTKVVAWHPMVLKWWKDLWQSPMAEQYLDSDVNELYALAELEDQFWRYPSADTLREIRLQRLCFGLTPIDRRRLQWELEKPKVEDEGDLTPPPSNADDSNVLDFLSGARVTA